MDQAKDFKHPKNPRKGANIISILTFGYMIPTFIKGYFKDLDENDVPKLLKGHCASTLGDKLERAWMKEKNSNSASLWSSIRSVFGLEFGILGAVMALDELILKLIRPLAIAQLLRYFSDNEGDRISHDEALICAGVIVGVSVISSLIAHFITLSLQVLGMKIRVACCSLIYRKSLVLSKRALASVTIGQITNLLSNDVGRIDSAVYTAHNVWLCPIQIILIILTMMSVVGLLSTVGILFMILLVPIQVLLGKKTSQLRLKTALQTDERVRLISEIIAGIKVIKMYTWEKPFEQLVSARRRLEVGEITKINYIRSFMKCAIYSPKFAIFITILAYVLTGNRLTAVYVYIVTCFYDTLKQSVCLFFIKGIADIAEVRVSISRITEFLLNNEIDSTILRGRPAITNNDNKPIHVGINLINVSARWCSTSSENTLSHINIKISDGDHVAVVGPVGCGKSSIIQLILGELQAEEGDVAVNGTISYASQEPWLFSGNIQQNILFGQPMNMNRYRTVVNACALEQDFTILPCGDQTLVGERGAVLSGGQRARINLARALYMDADIYLLDDPFSAVDTRVGQHMFNNCINTFLSKKCTVLVTHQMQHLYDFNEMHLIEKGKISTSGTISAILEFDSDFTKKLAGCNDENAAAFDDNAESAPISDIHQHNNQIVVDSNPSHPSINSNPLVYYIKVGGSIPSFVLVMLLITVSQVALGAGEYVTVYWLNQQQKFDDGELSEYSSPEEFAYSYSGIIIIMAITLFLQAVYFFRFCTKASVKLHNKMFASIMNASMTFFNLTTSGKILHRFSQDMGVADEQMPLVTIETIQIAFRLIIGVCLISLSNPWFLISSALLALGFYYVRTIYYSTNCRVKVFEASTRTPIFGHLNETLQGISTVRALGAKDILKKEFDHHQNIHSSVWHLYLTSTRAFIFYIDALCILYLTSIAFTLVTISAEQYAGNVGLAISQAIIILTSLQWGMLQSTELENNIASIERIANYGSIESEEPETHHVPSNLWPQQGAMLFNSLSLKYSTKGPFVLKNLNFSIKPKEKIGIVGRTGAGKSSLIAAIFQLARTQGSIVIDDVDIAELPLCSLRSKVSIIPQEPVIFSGTLRKNLDPFDLYSDEDLWLVLEEVELRSLLSNMNLGLSHGLSEGGSNLSVGQRQLICLARAILRKNKILVLDEATANVDPYTDTLIQNTIRRKFNDCTVLTIAHRLNTIMDSDKVLVMHNGELAEFDHPHILLEQNKGVFYSMVQQTGYSMANVLSQIAKDSYRKTYKIEAS